MVPSIFDYLDKKKEKFGDYFRNLNGQGEGWDSKRGFQK
jgi:hypothetical protein